MANRLRQLQGTTIYRKITTSTTESALEATWIGELDTELSTSGTGTARQVYDQDEILVFCWFLNSGDTIELEPHYYDFDDTLLGVGDQVTFTPTTDSSASVDIGDGAATHFAAPAQYIPNIGAAWIRFKATTLPTTSNVGIFIGTRS